MTAVLGFCLASRLMMLASIAEDKNDLESLAYLAGKNKAREHMLK